MAMTFEVKFADGTVRRMSGDDGEHACHKASDLWRDNGPVIAWRVPPVSVTVLGDPRRIIG
jgi:hypothetical protein